MSKIINWMGGWPKDGLVPSSEWEERLAKAADRLKRETAHAHGRPGLRDGVAEMLAAGLLRAQTGGKPERLRLLPFADAAIVRAAGRALPEGGVVLTERLTSRSALQAFRKAGVRVVAVPGDERGMDPDALAQMIARLAPALVYAAPVCSDPDGKVWDARRVRDVTRICREAGVALLRDDRQEPLLYDDAWHGRSLLPGDAEDGVLSLGQLPPGLIAGLRLGWAAGDPATLRRWMQASDAETGADPLEKSALAELMRDQPLEPLLDMLRVQGAVRMRRMVELLESRQVPGLRWRMPEGGSHLWLKLPDGIDGEALLRGAWIKGLMFQPGAPFYAAAPERNTLRLTFAYADDRQMKLGVARLVDAMSDFLGRFDIG